MFEDVLPFIHIAARDDHLKIINHLAHRETPGHNDDAGNRFASGDPG